MAPHALWNIHPKDWESYKITPRIPEGESGTWRVRHINVDENDHQRLNHALNGRDTGTGQFTTLQFEAQGSDGQPEWRPMMSDTRAEILEHYSVIDVMAWRDVNRVLIHGLGLGVVLNAALSFDHIEHVDVVDVSEDVIKLVGPTYTQDPRVTIHHGDSFTYKFPRGTRWDVTWYDIWPTIDSDNLPEMTALKRKYQNRTRWHAAWAEDRCRALRVTENMSDEELAALEWKRFERMHGTEVTQQVKQFINEQLKTHAVSPTAQPEEAYT